MVATVELGPEDCHSIGSALLGSTKVTIEANSEYLILKLPRGFLWRMAWDEVIDEQKALDMANQHISKIVRQTGPIRPGFLGARDEGDDLPPGH